VVHTLFALAPHLCPGFVVSLSSTRYLGILNSQLDHRGIEAMAYFARHWGHQPVFTDGGGCAASEGDTGAMLSLPMGPSADARVLAQVSETTKRLNAPVCASSAPRNMRGAIGQSPRL
jgi:hypothetical protein